MAKTKEELQQLKNEFETLNNKLKELTEDELNSIIGALDEHSILPKDGDMWDSWNPTPFYFNTNNDLDLLNHKANDVKIEKVTCNGSVSNREDK